MQGVVTRKHFWLIAKAFGYRKAMKVLFSRKSTALMRLMED